MCKPSRVVRNGYVLPFGGPPKTTITGRSASTDPRRASIPQRGMRKPHEGGNLMAPQPGSTNSVAKRQGVYTEGQRLPRSLKDTQRTRPLHFTPARYTSASAKNVRMRTLSSANAASKQVCPSPADTRPPATCGDSERSLQGFLPGFLARPRGSSRRAGGHSPVLRQQTSRPPPSWSPPATKEVERRVCLKTGFRCPPSTMPAPGLLAAILPGVMMGLQEAWPFSLRQQARPLANPLKREDHDRTYEYH